MKLNTTEVAQLRPDYIGFIFWEPSTRFFDGELPAIPHEVCKVGVFVDAEPKAIISTVKKYRLQAIQLHGAETPAYCEALSTELIEINQKVALIKVFSVRADFDFEPLRPYEVVCDYFLFDTKGKLPGGNGFSFDWTVLKNYPFTKPYFLSGGIGQEDLPKLNEFMQLPESKYCYAIDVNSKFEMEPGLKKIDELRFFKEGITDLPALRRP